MSSVFWERQLLHCQTTEQCMILNAAVRKGGREVDQMRTPVDRGRKMGSSFADVLYGRPQRVRHTHPNFRMWPVCTKSVLHGIFPFWSMMHRLKEKCTPFTKTRKLSFYLHRNWIYGQITMEFLLFLEHGQFTWVHEVLQRLVQHYGTRWTKNYAHPNGIF